MSEPKNDVIPLNLTRLSKMVTLVDNPVVTDVETIGDCKRLSIATITFAF